MRGGVPNAQVMLQAQQVQVVGEVSFASAAALRKAAERLFAQTDSPVVDLAQSQCVDSSAILCLLAWMRYAQAHNQRLRVYNIPEHLLAVAEVYGIKDMMHNLQASH